MKIARAASRRLIAIVAVLIAALTGLTACTSAAGGGDGGEEQTTIRYQSYAGAVDPFLLADALGEFEGLTLERVGDITGGPQALQALVSNQTDIGGSAFYGAIAQLVGTGAPIKAVVPSYGSNEQSNSKVVALKDSGEDVIRVVANPRQAEVPLVMVSFRDIADRKHAEATLQRQALTDPLTGIANRTAFMDRLDQALRRLERSSTALAVIYLDLDRFKVINDSMGHEVGDRLLVQVAERAVATIRPTDTFARLGGDEFVVLAEGLNDVEEANHLARRVCQSMEDLFVLEGESIVCTTSAGVATTSDFTHTSTELLQEADLALYRAKDRGRNRAEVFDEDSAASRADGRSSSPSITIAARSRSSASSSRSFAAARGRLRRVFRGCDHRDFAMAPPHRSAVRIHRPPTDS